MSDFQEDKDLFVVADGVALRLDGLIAVCKGCRYEAVYEGDIRIELTPGQVDAITPQLKKIQIRVLI